MIPLTSWDGERGYLAEDKEEDQLSKPFPSCPRCQSEVVQRSGKTPGGKQRLLCKMCGRSFVVRRDKGIENETRRIAVSLLSDGVSAPVVARALQGKCSRRWVYQLKAALTHGNR